jgi:hypothetical protein
MATATATTVNAASTPAYSANASRSVFSCSVDRLVNIRCGSWPANASVTLSSTAPVVITNSAEGAGGDLDLARSR